MQGERTVLIAGAGGNLGSAVAAAFAAQGARLALFDVTLKAPDAALDPDDDRKLRLQVNLLDQAAVDAAIAEVIKKFKRIDILCNIAGGFRMGEMVHETSDATWSLLLDRNIRTLLRTTRAVVPLMLAQGGGKIVNIGAAAALRGQARMGAYCATKDAVIRLTEAMAAEVRERGVNVNCVLPTIIDTPENRAAMPKADPSRWVSPAALADVILFLASDAARAIHGAAIPVSGLS